MTDACPLDFSAGFGAPSIDTLDNRRAFRCIVTLLHVFFTVFLINFCIGNQNGHSR